MRYLFIILAFISFAGYSQSVHIDSPTGTVSDFPIITEAEGSDIVVLFRNDSSKAITVANFQEPPHGWFAFHDSAVVLDMTEDQYSMITNPTSNLFSIVDATDLTFDGDSLTIERPGDYIITISLSFSGTAADSYEISFCKNGTIVDQSMNRSTSQTDIGNVSLPIYLENLIAGDDITFKIQNTASSDDATIISCSWVMWRLHE